LRGQTFSAQAGIPVQMDVVAFCSVSASDLDFGAYLTTGSAAALGQTVIQFTCTLGSVIEIALDAGLSGGQNQRQMSSGLGYGKERLNYDLYQDSARTVRWGDKSGQDTLELLATGAPQTATVFGQIPAGQVTPAGNYVDTITVVLLF
jgi:spore coat protein U-like protein